MLTGWLGHRRSWMLVCQGLIMLGLWLVAGSDPSRSLGTIAVFAVLVGFSSATQDIAIDAWRIEAAETSKQGAMAAAYQWGYRVAIIVAGAVPLLLAQAYGWNFSYARDGGADGGGRPRGAGGAARRAPRHPSDSDRRHSAGAGARGARMDRPARPARWPARSFWARVWPPMPGSSRACSAPLGAPGAARPFWRPGRRPRASGCSSPRWWRASAVIVARRDAASRRAHAARRLSARRRSAIPLRDFFSRYRSAAGLILALICLYRIPDFVLNIMNPFYLDLGYTLVEIAEIRKIFGVAMTMFGVFAGGLAVARYGLLRAMVIGAFAGPLSNLLFIWLAMQHHSLWALFAAIGLDNVAGGFAGTCLIAYMSSLTSAGFTATQYALFSSLYAIPGRLLASQSGRIVESAARFADSGRSSFRSQGIRGESGAREFRHRVRTLGRHAGGARCRLCRLLHLFRADRCVRAGAVAGRPAATGTRTGPSVGAGMPPGSPSRSGSLAGSDPTGL